MDTTTNSEVGDGAAFDDFFDSIGNKAANVENITNDSSHENNSTAGNLVAGEGERVVDEIESYCMNCKKDGITRLLLTRIPFFREIILMSFSCPHCGFKNSEVQSAGEIQQKGLKSELRLTVSADFARQVIKSDTCSIKFLELDIEVPPGRGQLTNVEGLLSMITEDLELQQPARREQTPEIWEKINDILQKGRAMLDGKNFPFRLSLDDPAGNSWIEPHPEDGVGKLSRMEYPRTPRQNEALGLTNSLSSQEQSHQAATSSSAMATMDDDDIVPNEVYSFPATCPGCTQDCTTHMKMVEIPHFAEVVIMSTVCDHCGYRSNEVKTGGEVPAKGKLIKLEVRTGTDLARDILKSESCSLECPELGLSVNPGTLGGRFTTVEGLLTQVRDDLHKQIFEFGVESGSGGDSLQSEEKRKWHEFFQGLDEAIQGQRSFTIILKDPLASSYVQNVRSPEADPQITSEEYQRTEEEEEELGLLDMKTENYGEMTD